MQVETNSLVWREVYPDLAVDPALSKTIASRSEEVIAALITWVPFLIPAHAPLEFVKAIQNEKNQPNMLENVDDLEKWVEMARWSDVLIFDLLLGNQDRLKQTAVRFLVQTFLKFISNECLVDLFWFLPSTCPF